MDKVITQSIKNQLLFKGARLFYIYCEWKSPVYDSYRKAVYCYSDKTQTDLYYRRSDRVWTKLAYSHV